MPQGNVTADRPQPKMKRVYYEGTDTLHEGYALCYNHDYGTATSEDEGRFFYVEKPSTTNALFFAGVVAPSGNDKVGPCYVDIILPGSYCNIWSYKNNTINTGRTTFCAGQYYFWSGGFPGQGSAVAKQTIARGTTAGLCYAYLEDGEQSGGVEVLTCTAGGATTYMASGVTFFATATLAGNATITLADGTAPFQRKGFYVEGTQTTNDVVVTITTPALIAAVATAGYDVVTMDDIGEGWFGWWMPGIGWFGAGKVAA